MGVVIRAHPVRGELDIQRNANREVAFKSRPTIAVDLFYNKLALP